MKLGWLTPGLALAGLLTVPAMAGASAAVVGAAGDRAEPPSASSPAPGGSSANGGASAGGQVFQEVCGACHDLTVSTDQTKSREDWQATVARMVNSGAPLSDEQAAEVVDYLAKNYGTR